MPLLHAIAMMALAVVVGVVGGCVHGQRAGGEERAALAASVRAANSSIETCAASLSAMQQHAHDELARADLQAEATQQALEDVVRENLALAGRLGEVEQQMAAARQEPTCRAQLEAQLCDSIPLL